MAIENNTSQKYTEKSRRIMGIILTIFAIAFFYFLGGKKAAEIVSPSIGDENMVITTSLDDSFSISLDYNDIQSIEKISNLEPGTMVSGVDNKKGKCGIWENVSYSEYQLCMMSGIDEYILLKTANGYVILNYESKDATESLYTSLKEFIETK